jgi:hypothetical protein
MVKWPISPLASILWTGLHSNTLLLDVFKLLLMQLLLETFQYGPYGVPHRSFNNCGLECALFI